MNQELRVLDSISPRDAEKMTVLALPANFEDGKSILDWAFKQFLPKDFKCIVVSVVHTPNHMIPLRRELLDKFREIEKEKLTSVLNKYFLECRQKCKLKPYKILLEADNITEGLLCIIRKIKITNLVIGTIAHSQLTASNILNNLMREADPSCKIWFFSNGEIILTRNVQNADATSASSSNANNQIINFQGDLDSDIDIHEMFKKKISEESKIRANAEKEMFSICQKAILLMTKMSSDLHDQDTHWRNELDEYLSRAKREREILKTENIHLKTLNLETPNTSKRNLVALKKEMTECELATKNLQQYFWASLDRLDSLETDYRNVKESRDDAIKEIRELYERIYRLERDYKKLEKERENALNANKPVLGCEFSLEEINQATNYFNDSQKIGKGRFGRVYKGHLRNLPVVIKKLDPQNLQDKSEYEQELEIVTKMRHPNIVNLIGFCPEATALIYEHFCNGTLEDRINRVNRTPPLRWRTRTKIIGEICKALIFLHSNKPEPIVHGDLKTRNVLLDSNLVCKIRVFGKVGASRLVNRFQEMNPYRDPEIRSTGQIKPHSDVYSLGIIILHLLTGKPSFNLGKKVQAATDTEISLMIDQAVGNWPYNQAIKLARIGSRCANPSRNRPGLTEVWKLIEPLVRAANSSVSPCVCTLKDDDDHVPSYFLCPITQEIMKEPHVAADGYTYELGAIKTWIRTGHDRSPITNLPLNNVSLIPNRALRSSIQEWLQHHPRQ